MEGLDERGDIASPPHYSVIPVFVATGTPSTHTYLSTPSARHYPASVHFLLCNYASSAWSQISRTLTAAFISRQRPSSGPYHVAWALPWPSPGHKDIPHMNDRAGTSPASPFDPLVGVIVCNARAMPHPTPAGPQATATRAAG